MSKEEIFKLFMEWKMYEFGKGAEGFIETLNTEAEIDMVRSWRMVYDYGFESGYSCAVDEGYLRE